MILVLMGVSGSGKTTLGQMVADAMKYPFLDGDSLHSQANIQKMTQGIRLTDADRAPWIFALHTRMSDACTRGESLIVGCSALKQSYRTALGEGLPLTWVYLKGSVELLRSRLARRQSHFMKADMLSSQLEELEEPSNTLVIDISQPPAVVVEQILTEFRTVPEGARRQLPGDSSS